MFKVLIGEVQPASAKEATKEVLLGILLAPLVLEGLVYKRVS